MLSSRYDDTGFRQFADRLDKLDALVEQQTRQVEGRAKLSILDRRKTGRLYPRGQGRFHRASAPGEAPADDTGILALEIATGQEKRFAWFVRATAPYAGYLELGTRNIAPRPFLKPALDQQWRAFLQAIERWLGV